jgi:LytS/YehU family sensor histidine kinase
MKICPRVGVGLANTRERLRELYGAAGSLRLKTDGGTEVEIRVPFHTAA